MLHQSIAPARLRIDNRQAANRILWSGPDWQWLRIIFLSSPENKGGCIWCGNIATVVCHPGNSDVYRDREGYLDFRRAGCYPMCPQCNNAEFHGKILCPRCRQQGHYISAGIDGKGDGQVCWSCKPAEIREALVFGKEHRNRQRNKSAKDRYARAHPTVKRIVNGKWVKIKR